MTAFPVFLSRVSAGFPSPADDFIEQTLDLNEYLVPHPSATFFLRTSGDSMQNAGIFSGDLLIVDRSLTPRNNDIVVAALNGELTLKRLCQRQRQWQLVAENSAYPPIPLSTGETAAEPQVDLTIWGVVAYNIHPFKRAHT